MEQGLSYAMTRVQFGKSRSRIPARRRQDRHDGGGDHDRAPDHRPRGARRRISRPALRPRSRHGEAAAARVAWADADNAVQIHGGNGLRRLPNTRSHASVRRAHPQYFRGRRRDSGPGDRAAPVGWDELSTASAVEFLSSFVDCRGYGLDGCFQTRQFVKDDVPNNAVGKATVFVPQNIAYPAHTWPRNSRPQVCQIVRNCAACFRYDFNCSLNEPTELPTVREVRKGLSACDLFDALDRLQQRPRGMYDPLCAPSENANCRLFDDTAQHWM